MNMTDINTNYLNDLNGSEWTKLSKSVQTYDSPITKKRKMHGAAFPLDLAKHFIKTYSKPGDNVFDPFAGVGTVLDAANVLQRHSFGTELNEIFFDFFNQGIDPKDGELDLDYKREMFPDSALNLRKYIEEKSIDLIVTSPPYSNLLNIIRNEFADKDFNGNTYKNQSRKLAKPYSNNPLDLGNLTYKEYLAEIEKLMSLLLTVSKEGAYNVWVVRDYRDTKNKVPYVNLHGDLINVAIQAGWVLWDIVIWDQSSQRKLVRLGGNKSRRYYFNIGHSFILIFRKNMTGEVLTNDY
ncbi:MAG: hypothetical protein PWQ50_172 [Methanolobus sp.]|jgi:DNA modification methylase|nr:hypothetical protein [Methanolobus sp.]